MKIAVLVSGGVDSAVALNLLKDQGHTIAAFYLKIWLEDELTFLGDCPWEEDLSYVRDICKQIDVPLEIVPLQKEYFDTVVAYTIKEVKEGKTPNPDIMCNSHIKFGVFFDKLKEIEELSGEKFDKIATGHYAQVGDKQYTLKQAPDPIKDQTYFLARLSKEQLQKIMFPIGHLTKNEVRELAEKFDLPNKARKDSQGICFLGKLKYNDFLKHYLGEETGDIIDVDTNEKLGEHNGFWYHTIGQRKGIKLGNGPYFVAAKDTEKNIVYVSKNYHDEKKERNILEVTDFNWFEGRAPQKTNLKAKLRHGPEFYNCTFEKLDENRARITLDDNDQGIAPGQFAVFYDEDICLGSAKISS